MDFIEKEKEFLLDVGIDYVALYQLYAILYEDKRQQIPTKSEFQQVLSFIRYLYDKYGENLHYTIGPGEPIEKGFEEFMVWLLEEYNKGHFQNIDFGVWFDLDEEVIPQEYIPKEMTSNLNPFNTGVHLIENLEFSNYVRDHPDCFLYQLEKLNTFHLIAFQKFIDDVVDIIKQAQLGFGSDLEYQRIFIDLFSIYSYTLTRFDAHFDPRVSSTIVNFEDIRYTYSLLIDDYRLVMESYLEKNYEAVKDINFTTLEPSPELFKIGKHLMENIESLNFLREHPDCFLYKLNKDIFDLQGFQNLIEDIVDIVKQAHQGQGTEGEYQGIYHELFSTYSYVLKRLRAHLDTREPSEISNYPAIEDIHSQLITNYELVMKCYLEKDYEAIKDIDFTQLSR